MNARAIEVRYNTSLKPLERVLARVKRPGDFYATGSLEAPMPRIDVHGVGVLSFPVPRVQARELIAQCERAPYGRGSETVLDESVRKVWQLAPSKVRIGGRSWPHTFEQIVSAVSEQLGCTGAKVSADLYKLLVYDKGAFFKPHRDTEKADGMFGTLLIVLPSQHEGGEVLVRHAGREAKLDLRGTEPSELCYAAFYADCEHEVLPVEDGNRVCLVYNLLQTRAAKGKRRPPLGPPVYETEVAAAAQLLENVFANAGAPIKIAWLLEHQYSPAGLAFAALKNADAARAQVMRAAAARAGCALHLGLVHIEEYGAAELTGDPYSDSRGWYHDFDDEGEEESCADSDEFEVVEVVDGRQYVDNWLNLEDDRVDVGNVPLADGEVLPAGALDGEPPDEQRVTEATGNEGASFERFYHRAALVIWPRNRSVDVLLQAGVHAALPYLEQRMASSSARVSDGTRAEVLEEARRVVAAWECEGTSLDNIDDFDSFDEDSQDSEDEAWDRELDGLPFVEPADRADRGRMIALLHGLGDEALLARFVGSVVPARFDGSEAAALAAAAPLLGAKRCADLFAGLVREKMQSVPRGCIELLVDMVRAPNAPAASGWSVALRRIAASVVAALPALRRATSTAVTSADPVQKARALDGDTLAALLDALARLELPKLRQAACSAIVANGQAFDARDDIVPALQKLGGGRTRRRVLGDAEAERLWLHAADTLLGRSEHPPPAPRDWRLNVQLSCQCDDCCSLQAFAADPDESVHRFRVRKDRRRHLHRQIDRHALDMTHVTERKGSPHTLVCTKTRWSFERRCEEYRRDVAALVALADLLAKQSRKFASHRVRIKAAQAREAANR